VISWRTTSSSAPPLRNRHVELRLLLAGAVELAIEGIAHFRRTDLLAADPGDIAAARAAGAAQPRAAGAEAGDDDREQADAQHDEHELGEDAAAEG